MLLHFLGPHSILCRAGFDRFFFVIDLNLFTVIYMFVSLYNLVISLLVFIREIKFLFFFMCLRIKSRSPPTRKYPKEVSELANRDWDNELSKPSENPEHPAATNVSIVEPYTAVIENNLQRKWIQRRPTQETKIRGKKWNFQTLEDRNGVSKKWVLQNLQTRQWTGQPSMTPWTRKD